MTLDSLGMRAAALALPKSRWPDAPQHRSSNGIDGLPERERVSQVLALGMGGSGIAGDVALRRGGSVRTGA